MSIIQYETGLTVYDGTCEDGSISVNTAEWKSGMYVAVANDGENVITQFLPHTHRLGVRDNNYLYNKTIYYDFR